MIQNKFSFRREIFFIGIGIGVVVAILLSLMHNVYLIWTVFAFYLLICLSLPFVRCRNCNVLLFRYNSAKYGIPHPKFVFPIKRCPVCQSNMCVFQALPTEPIIEDAHDPEKK